MSIERIDFEDCGYAFIMVNDNDEIERWLFCYEINRCCGCEVGLERFKRC